jgi:hypothetical protein
MGLQAARCIPSRSSRMKKAAPYVTRAVHESLCPCCDIVRPVEYQDGQWVFQDHLLRADNYLRPCDGSGSLALNPIHTHKIAYVQHR